MRTSCRFAMAVHVLAVLAYKQGDRVTSSYLAASVNTNPVIVRRLLLTLQKAKLVETRKGAGSGSRLERSPARITLAEVYNAVEEEDAFTMPSREPNQGCPVGQCIQDELDLVFTAAESAMIDQLGRTTVADIVNSVRSKCNKQDAA
ncbi:MAG TPA: Rrf2 family transcriptional regulator [Candidatus Kapabacteria bacterium]|nr:Rrf2 family transcriptional regulator [Candidatus Kapabacteria bacterium]